MDYFELDGSMVMKSEFQEGPPNAFVNLDYSFMCDPRTTENYLSDAIYIDDYIRKICRELNISCDIGAVENYHIFMNINNKIDAQKVYDRIKERISVDFNVTEFGE